MTKKRTKVEYTREAKRNGLKVAVIREIYVDSGKVKCVRCELSALDWQSLGWQIEGALAAIQPTLNTESK